MSEKISIIMPAYNAGKFIAEAIESILLQTYPNWELVVVDDESADHTAEIVKLYQKKDSRIKYFWQKNSKQGKARNAAIGNSDGFYIAFMDADDVWLPDKLSRQVFLLEKNTVDLVFGYAYLIKHAKKTLELTGRGHGFYQGREAVDFLLYHSAFLMSSVLVRRNAIEQVDCFVEDLKVQYCEDWHLWLKLAFEGFSFYTDGSVFSYYRIHEESNAMTEKEAQIKFFFALLDLHHRYPEYCALKETLAKRAYQLVYHSQVLNEQLIESITEFLKANGYVGFWSQFYKPLYRLNQAIFRKFFLYSFRKRIVADN